MIEPFTLCLALNIYHEARGEPVQGQIAVALVTLKRAKRNPKLICPTVYKAHQFSWTSVQHLPVSENHAWQQSLALAKVAWHFKDITNGATHYHAVSVRPYWIKKMVYCGKIGNHHFYKER